MANFLLKKYKKGGFVEKDEVLLRKIKDLRPLKFENNKLYVINQLKLPQSLEWVELSDYKDVADAIRNMIIRGAPLIGIIGAYGFAIGIKQIIDQDKPLKESEVVLKTLKETRPTAVNLFWAPL